MQDKEFLRGNSSVNPKQPMETSENVLAIEHGQEYKINTGPGEENSMVQPFFPPMACVVSDSHSGREFWELKFQHIFRAPHWESLQIQVVLILMTTVEPKIDIK